MKVRLTCNTTSTEPPFDALVRLYLLFSTTSEPRSQSVYPSFKLKFYFSAGICAALHSSVQDPLKTPTPSSYMRCVPSTPHVGVMSFQKPSGTYFEAHSYAQDVYTVLIQSVYPLWPHFVLAVANQCYQHTIGVINCGITRVALFMAHVTCYLHVTLQITRCSSLPRHLSPSTPIFSDALDARTTIQSSSH